MIQDGKSLQSDFTFFNSDGTKSTGTGISRFDPKTNRFTTVWYEALTRSAFSGLMLINEAFAVRP